MLPFDPQHYYAKCLQEDISFALDFIQTLRIEEESTKPNQAIKSPEDYCKIKSTLSIILASEIIAQLQDKSPHEVYQQLNHMTRAKLLETGLREQAAVIEATSKDLHIEYQQFLKIQNQKEGTV